MDKGYYKKRNWKGVENVLDAGCGTGKITKMLSSLITEGKLYAIDNDPNMILKAKENLCNIKNVKVIRCDLASIELDNIPIKFDVIFSNAVLHWILDHYTVLRKFYALLNFNGQLLIQCGGYGNLKKSIAIFNYIKESPEFIQYFANWQKSWYFAKPEKTKNILKEIGYKDVDVYLKKVLVNFESKEEYSIFLKTIVLRPYLKYLPGKTLQNKFLEKILSHIEKNSPRLMWNLDYVRLNIFAKK